MYYLDEYEVITFYLPEKIKYQNLSWKSFLVGLISFDNAIVDACHCKISFHKLDSFANFSWMLTCTIFHFQTHLDSSSIGQCEWCEIISRNKIFYHAKNLFHIEFMSHSYFIQFGMYPLINNHDHFLSLVLSCKLFACLKTWYSFNFYLQSHSFIRGSII